MRRKPTEAQKARAEERRGKARGLCRQLKAMSDEERLALAERVPGLATIEGHPLSLHNQCLIAYQRPGATLVGGYRQWTRQGRQVMKGEHGLSIWVPSKRKGNGVEADDENADEPEEIRFLVGTVFDVSQTAEKEAE